MCVILHKPENEKLPSEQILKNCFENNPDGAGFMYPSKNNKSVQIHKGFMTFKSFMKGLQTTLKFNDETIPMVLHFRIGTHGKKRSPSYTHPFPLSDDPSYLKMRECSCNVGIVHNGILSGFTSNNKLSDTMEFISKILMPLTEINTVSIHDDRVKNLIKNIIGSYNRMGIMDNSGTVSLIGNFQKFENCYYSNDSYLKIEKYDTEEFVYDDDGYDYSKYYKHYHKINTGNYNKKLITAPYVDNTLSSSPSLYDVNDYKNTISWSEMVKELSDKKYVRLTISKKVKLFDVPNPIKVYSHDMVYYDPLTFTLFEYVYYRRYGKYKKVKRGIIEYIQD
jgi:hypothetical protein